MFYNHLFLYAAPVNGNYPFLSNTYILKRYCIE